jgi:ATP-dependent Clp protease adaptor protein ClpS
MPKVVKERSPRFEPEIARVKPPPLFRVLLLNDDYTPMDFVVQILETIFAMERSQAVSVMLQVHNEGRGICGVYPHDIAATKVAQVLRRAAENQHPLKCVMEESET